VNASTGDRWLDELLGGGFPKGFTVLYGGEGSGRTTLLLQVSAVTIKNGGKAAYIDVGERLEEKRAGEILEAWDAERSRFKLLKAADTHKTFILLRWIRMDSQISLIVLDNLVEDRWVESIVEAVRMFGIPVIGVFDEASSEITIPIGEKIENILPYPMSTTLRGRGLVDMELRLKNVREETGGKIDGIAIYGECFTPYRFGEKGLISLTPPKPLKELGNYGAKLFR